MQLPPVGSRHRACSRWLTKVFFDPVSRDGLKSTAQADAISSVEAGTP